MEGQQITTVAGVECGTRGFVSKVHTVIVSVTPPAVVNTATVRTMEVGCFIASAIDFIAVVRAVSAEITKPDVRDAPVAICAPELVVGARFSAVFLVPSIATIVITITTKTCWYTLVIVTLDVVWVTCRQVTVGLIRVVTTIVVAITNKSP